MPGLLPFAVWKRQIGGHAWRVHKYVKTAQEAAALALALNAQRGTVAVARSIYEAPPR